MKANETEISEVGRLVARMIVTEGDILTESQWAVRVAEIIREFIANANMRLEERSAAERR